MSLLANSNAIEDAGYNIQRSLRFRSSASAYLSRTPASAGNRRTFTLSVWVKRGRLGATQWLFDADNGSTDSTEFNFAFTSSDTLSVSGSLTTWRITTQVFRDPSAWYHILLSVDTTQATANNRIRLYVNGSEITAFSTTNNPTQNLDLGVNQAIAHYLGIRTGLTSPLDGYLAEVNFIDGQALTPSSFGQTDPVTGVWTPKKYAGTYGTNGFYLPFSDNTSATTLAYDKSGNGNNWTPNNISTTAGATYDSMTDVPTLTSATAANYCVLNPLNKSTSASVTGGNLNSSLGTGGWLGIAATMPFVTGQKWYCEFTVQQQQAIDFKGVGIVLANQDMSGYNGGGGASYEWNFLGHTSSIYNNGSAVVTGLSTYGVGDIIQFAFDQSAGKWWVGKNGTWYKSGDPAAGTNETLGSLTNSAGYVPFVSGYGSTTPAIWNANFGQRPFSYTPPTGFKALNTFNLPDPTIKKPNQYMDATTYTGNGSTQTITNAGGFQPDLVWVKARSNAGNHSIFDTSRGINNVLSSNLTSAQDATPTDSLTAFNSNGFSVGANLTGTIPYVNQNTQTYVGWQWKESATAGFDIVTFTSDGTSLQTVSHSLGVSPAMIIVKARSATGNWSTYQKNLTSTNYYLNLNTTAAQANLGAQAWGVSASNFQVNSVNLVGSNGTTAVAYLFAEIAGFSKFGSYTGNGSADGPFVYCGFRPKYVMIKNSTTTGNANTGWYEFDSVRNTYNAVGNSLRAELSDAETTGYAIDFLSNGFKLRISDAGINNASAATHIFAAFAESPFKTSLAR